MANEEKMLCPFKKVVTREVNRKTGKVEITERFLPCAGERCMAYIGRAFNPDCKRMECSKGTGCAKG